MKETQNVGSTCFIRRKRYRCSRFAALETRMGQRAIPWDKNYV